MLKSSALGLAAAIAAWSFAAAAQAPPPASEGEDIEVPARTDAAPAAAPPAPSPAREPGTAAVAPATSAPAASSQAHDAELERQMAELRARLDAVEQARAPKPASESSEPSAPPAASRPSLQIDGYLQAQYFHNQASEDQLLQGGTPLNQNQFLLRRGRLRVERAWDYADALLELDANTVRGATVGIRRAEASLLYRGRNPRTQPPLVMLTAGVTDIPFSFELAEVTRTRPFMERTFGSLALFPTEMDIGLKLSGAVGFVRYGFAVMNGQPVNTLASTFAQDPNGTKDYSGRVGVVVEPVRGLTLSGGTSFLQGSGFHRGNDATKPTVTFLDQGQDGKLDLVDLVAVPGTAASRSQNFHRWAYALDLALALRTALGDTSLYGEAFLAQNLDRGYLIADPISNGLDVREAGAFVALVQDVTAYGFVGARWSTYDPNSDALDARRGKQLPASLTVTTVSPLLGVRLPERAKLYFEYDFVRDHMARDGRGVPADQRNDQYTLRLQVDL